MDGRAVDELGLHVLHEPDEPSTLDVVMVHGLTGGCDSTWTTKDVKTQQDVNWAQDFIKKDIPTARIMTYGYDASYGTASKKTPFDYARNLLGELDDVRLRSDGSYRRPLIFIAHSLGGIVVKEALIQAHDRRDNFEELLLSVRHLLFFGTPHQGTQTASIAGTLNKIVRFAYRSHDASATAHLSLWESSVLEANNKFVHLADAISFTTLVETQKYGPAIVVEEGSATLNKPREKVIALAANHSTMCKFGDYRSYKQSVGRRMVKIHDEMLHEEHGRESLQERLAELPSKLDMIHESSSTSHQKTHSMLNNTQRDSKRDEVMKSLWFPEMSERQESIKPPSFDTFEWIFEDSVVPEDERRRPQERLEAEMRGKFARWLRSDEPLFWISGKAGSGKSSLMSLIQDDPRTNKGLSVWANDRSIFTFSFYFWRPGTSLQKSTNGLLRSLLYQLGKAKPVVIDSIEIARPPHNSAWMTKSLVLALHQCLSAFDEDRIFLMIDGLDEYESDYGDLLDELLQLQERACLKMCIASRPETIIFNKLKMYPGLQLQLLNKRDIEVFVKGRLTSLPTDSSYDICEDVVSRAEGVFLWAVLVSEDIRSGAADGDDTHMLRKRLRSLPTELYQLFERLFEKINDVHLEAMKVCLFHLDARFWSRRGNDQHCSLGYIAACMPEGEYIKTSEDLLDCCTRNSTRLIAQGKGSLELRDGHVPHGTSAWIFDTRRNKFFSVNENTMKLCQQRVTFVHRSAHDFMLGLEGAGSEHSRWHLTEKDIERFVEGALRGCETLIRFLPLSIRDFDNAMNDFLPPRSVDTTIFSRLVSIVASFNVAKQDHIIGVWLDRIYDMLPERFATQRTALLSPALRKAWSLEVDLSTTWHVEEDFWLGAILLDGYLESRWNKLAEHPHAGAICSILLLSPILRPRLSLELLDKCLNQLFAEAGPAKAPPIIKCIRAARAIDNDWTISWDATGGLDERYNMANMGQSLLEGASFETHDVVSDRGQRVFVGTTCLSWPLQIQFSVPSGLMWQFESSLSRLSVQGIKHIRLLSVAPQDDKKVCLIPYTEWEVYEDLVDSVCDVPVEFREAVPVHIFRRGRFDDRYACFTGTRNQFVECLTQVQDGIRANKNNQLSPSQQANMLELVEKEFQYHWKIVTPETLELSQITLKYVPEEYQRPGLLGDLYT